MRSSRHIYGRLGGAHPARIRALSPAAWYQPGVGQTVTGAGVSRWADQALLDGTRDLLQGTDTNRPALQADGSVLFDGVDNYLKTAAFTLNQPATYYLVAKQITWTDVDTILDGVTGRNSIGQSIATPKIVLYAGSAATNDNTGLAVDAKGIITAVFNGASSLLGINAGAAATGNPGSDNAGGITLGSWNAANNYFANIQAWELIAFAASHDAGQRATVRNYLAARHGIAL